MAKVVPVKGDHTAAVASPQGTTGVYVVVDRGGILHMDGEGNIISQFRDSSYGITTITQIGDKIVAFAYKRPLGTDWQDLI